MSIFKKQFRIHMISSSNLWQPEENIWDGGGQDGDVDRQAQTVF
jgi:hypothetical protein